MARKAKPKSLSKPKKNHKTYICRAWGKTFRICTDRSDWVPRFAVVSVPGGGPMAGKPVTTWFATEPEANHLARYVQQRQSVAPFYKALVISPVTEDV